LTDAQAANLASFADGGGTLVVGFGSGITDEHLRIRLGGYLGEPLRAALGVWIEEFAPPAAPDLRARGGGVVPPVPLTGELVGHDAFGAVWSEFVRAEDAEVIARFADGALDGWPAVTRRPSGRGSGWYVATLPGPDALRRLAQAVVADAGVEVPPAPAPGVNVESVRRGGHLFVINHGTDDVRVELEGTDILTDRPAMGLVLPSQGVAIVR
jgi:beta-galactosidase